MDLKDATLMVLGESTAHPSLARLAQSAYDQLIGDGQVDYRVLSDLVAEASGKGRPPGDPPEVRPDRARGHLRADPAGDRPAEAGAATRDGIHAPNRPESAHGSHVVILID
jgi:hypothetical protein